MGESPIRAIAGRLVLAGRVVPGRIAVEDGRIASVVEDPADPEAAAGPLIAPGFIDVHVHGWGGHDATGDAAALSGMARALLRQGVTSFLPTAPTLPEAEIPRFAERVRSWMPVAPADGAEPLGFNLEGPFLAPARKGAHDPALLRTPAELDPALLDAALDGLRIITIAPELPGALELIGRLAALGIAPSIGHSNATLEEALAGYAAGGRTTTHLFNAMTGVDHRLPGLAVAALTDDDAYVELIADGNHVHPALWPIITRTKPANRLVLVVRCAAAGRDGRRAGVRGRARCRGARRPGHPPWDRHARGFRDRARHGRPEPGAGGTVPRRRNGGSIGEPRGAARPRGPRDHRARPAGPPRGA